MPDHTVNSWLMIKDEGAYGAGIGAGAEYSEGKGTAPTDFDPFQFPMGEQSLPYSEFERENIRSVGDDEETVLTVNKSFVKKEATTKTYIQESTYGAAAISAAAGQPGDSFVIHYQKPEANIEATGCVVEEYTVELPTFGDFPSESIKWNYYHASSASVVAMTKPAIPHLRTQPSVGNDMSFDIDSLNATTPIDLKSCTFKIVNEFEEIQIATAWLGRKPQLKSRVYTLEVVFHTTIATLDEETATEVLTATELHAVDLDFDLAGSWALTNMFVKESNIEKMPEFGLYEFTMTLEMGTGFTAAHTP